MLRNLRSLALTAGLVTLASCDVFNVGGDLANWGPQPGAITVPSGKVAGESGEFSVAWTSGTLPFTISWDFGGGADPGTLDTPATSPNSQTVLLNVDAGGSFTVTAQVTDAQSLSGSASAQYSYGPSPNTAPVLTVTAGDGTTSITVQADDADGDDVTITATAPAGFSVDGPLTVTGLSGDVTFNFIPDDFLAGGSGEASFTGNDGMVDSDPVTATVTAPGPATPDTLYAIALDTTVSVDQPTTVIVVTSVPANPFQYLNGCRVTAPTGFTYVPNSFNVGMTGGAAGDADGFWTNMAPSGGFLLAPDNFYEPVSGGPGLTAYSFNVTPIGGADTTTSSGPLFNFEASFSAAGTYTLGFLQESGGIKRTYYSEGSGTEYFWGDISNNHAGIPSTVTVE